MAGNEFTQVIPCLRCGKRAERIRVGVETDRYRCVAGHEFLVDWSRGRPPTAPLWPPPDRDDDGPG